MKSNSSVTERSAEITRLIQNAARASRNEADFRKQFSRVIEDFAKELDIPVLVREEYTLAKGRADAAYNRLILEYEPPGSLRPSLTHKHTAHAVQQVKDYIEGVAQKERQEIHRLAGVALDGHYYVFIRHVDGHFLVEDPVPVNEYTTGRFLRLLVSLTSGKALLPENLIKDFGSHTLTAERAARGFYDALSLTLQAEPEGLVAMLFKQWRTFYGEVTGYGEGSTQIKHKKELQEFARGMGVDPKKMNPPLLFFTVHTYFSLLVKLIAYLALSRFVSGFGTRFGNLYSLDDERLATEMDELERGGLFKRLGIRNFLEGDFFRWYLKAWNKDVADSVRLLVTRLRDYDPGTLEVSPEAARDLLKNLYHYLMPRELRHDLGEYYTPDWLADRLLNQLGYEGDTRKRLLDPACGSGTFLVLAIARLKSRCLRVDGMTEQETLNTILRNIVGIDLNPLATIAARTNYLLAIRELLEHRTEDIDIPVYLADAIVSPEVGRTLFGKDRYEIRTTVGPLDIPSALKSRKQIDCLANLLGECVEARVEVPAFLARAQRELEIPVKRWEGSDGEGEAARDILGGLFVRLSELHGKGLDGIWAAIVKNYFMPLFVGQFDLVAGNPPWVNWEHLPQSYREESATLWNDYELFPGTEKTSLSSKRSKVDISLLMTQVVLNRLLVHGGRLGFVLPQTIFQTETGGRGFRKFSLPDGRQIAVTHVDDLVELQPFEGATNRTSVAIMQTGSATRYPVPYTYWVKRGSGFSISQDATLDEVHKETGRRHWHARPISRTDRTSPWIIGRPKAIKAVEPILGASPYKELVREGSNTRGANGIFWIRVLEEHAKNTVLIQNLPELGRNDEVPQREAIVEWQYVYPLLRGRNVTRWRVQTDLFIVVPHDERKASEPVSPSVLVVDAPKTHQFLMSFEQPLRRRKKFRNFDPANGTPYGLYNVGAYTFSPFKVVWREQAAGVLAAVATEVKGKTIVPDHKLMCLPLGEKTEAHYVCALLNSTVVRYIVKSYAIDISISTHLLDYINIPKFERTNRNHMKLAQLSCEAHQRVETDDRSGISELESQIDGCAAKIWSISGDAFDEIRGSYEQLSSVERERQRKEDDDEERSEGLGESE
jgi:methylase of polypeptide subunit release factors